MSEDSPQEVQDFFDSIKHQLMEVIPDSISGFLILLLVSMSPLKNYSNYSIEFLASVAETAIYIFVVGCCYYLGRATRFLANDLLSRISASLRRDKE